MIEPARSHTPEPAPAPPAAVPVPGRIEDLAPPKVSEQDLVELRMIAQTVGGDFGMTVRLGQPGGGSYFDPLSCIITLDPDHVGRDPSLAKFVTGHEGAHRRYTSSPYTLGLSRAQIDGMYKRIGFASTDNVIEDQAINDSMVRQFPGMAAHTRHAYEVHGPKKGGILGHPEVLDWIRTHGYVPKFSAALSALLCDWALWRKDLGYKESYADGAGHGRFHETLDKDVDKCVRSILAAARTAASETVPAGCLDEAEIRSARARRLDIIDRHVFPEIAKLVEGDTKTEALRQMMNGNGSHTLSGRAKREIREASQKASGQEAAELTKALREAAEMESSAAGGGDGGASPEEIRAKRKDLEEKRAEALEKLEKLDPSLPRKAHEALAEEAAEKMKKDGPKPPPKKSWWKRLFGKREEAPPPPPDPVKELENEISERIRQQKSEKGESALPLEKLSARTLSDLQDAFDSLPEPVKDELLEAARKELEKLDDAISGALGGKLTSEHAQTHSERRESEEEMSGGTRSLHASRERLERDLEAVANRHSSAFRASFERMSDQIEVAANRLRRVFLPEEIFRWERDRPHGERVDMRKAMASKRTPELRAEMFMKRIEPTRSADAIEVLIDISGSMANGNKAVSTLDAAVFVSELAERLKIKCEMLVFSDNVQVLKSADESIASALVQARFDRITKPSGGNDDALAVRTAYDRLTKLQAKNRFLLVLSDAEVCTPEALRSIVSRIASEQRAILCHFGIGEGTRDDNGFYPISFGGLPVHVTPAERACGLKSFLDVFCEETEKMVLRPESFLRRAGGDKSRR